MKKIVKLIGVVLMSVFALALTVGALQVSAEGVEVAVDGINIGTDFSASLVNPEDRPEEALTSPFRVAVMGILNYFLTFLGLVCVAFIIYAGVLLVVDGGGEENAGKAKNIILYAGVGLVLVLLSWSIVNWMIGFQDTIA